MQNHQQFQPQIDKNKIIPNQVKLFTFTSAALGTGIGQRVTSNKSGMQDFRPMIGQCPVDKNQREKMALQASFRTGPSNNNLLYQTEISNKQNGGNSSMFSRTNTAATKMFMDGAIRTKGMQQPLAKMSSFNSQHRKAISSVTPQTFGAICNTTSSSFADQSHLVSNWKYGLAGGVNMPGRTCPQRFVRQTTSMSATTLEDAPLVKNLDEVSDDKQKLESLLESVEYDIIGSRGTFNLQDNRELSQEEGSLLESAAVQSKGSNFGSAFNSGDFMDGIKSKKLVFFGEIHSIDEVIKMETAVAMAMLTQSKEKASGKNDGPLLHIVMEHFSFEMQNILDDFQSGKIDMEKLNEEYARIGTEGHNIMPYQPLLKFAQENKGLVKLHGGFIPRIYAKTIMRESLEEALRVAKQKDYIPQDVTDLEGTDLHYNMFESLISQRNMYDKGVQPSDGYQKIFKAQLLKDYAMAYKVVKLLKTVSEESQILVIAGKGHTLHYCGVPERILQHHSELRYNTASVIAHQADPTLKLGLEIDQTKNAVAKLYGESGMNPADYIFLYKEVVTEDPGQDVKNQVAEAHDKVGETAFREGDLKKAEAIMTYIGYSPEEIAIAGKDAYNYQGVGNPFKYAEIKDGDRVLDIGCGLGVDSFIAKEMYNKHGKVTGIDISQKQVDHAQGRASERNSLIDFQVADMERLPFADNSFDVVISNGAFCLAPNKEVAFSEIYRVLTPGGRMSICTSTVQQDLQPGVNWPICMQMFIHKSQLDPICAKVGFKDILVDDTNSLMAFQVPGFVEEQIEEENEKENERFRVHVGSDEFSHLKNFNMNELCSRVILKGVKPVAVNV